MISIILANQPRRPCCQARGFRRGSENDSNKRKASAYAGAFQSYMRFAMRRICAERKALSNHIDSIVFRSALIGVPRREPESVGGSRAIRASSFNPTAPALFSGARRQMQNSRSRAEGVQSYVESKRTRIEKQKYNKKEKPARVCERVSTLKCNLLCEEFAQSEKRQRII